MSSPNSSPKVIRIKIEKELASDVGVESQEIDEARIKSEVTHSPDDEYNQIKSEIADSTDCREESSHFKSENGHSEIDSSDVTGELPTDFGFTSEENGFDEDYKTVEFKYAQHTKVNLFRGAGELHEAVCLGDMSRIRQLVVEQQCDINAVDCKKLTPLHYLFLGPPKLNCLEIVNFCHEHGADFSAKDLKGQDIITLLLRNNLFNIIPKKFQARNSAFAYALDQACRIDSDSDKLEELKVFLNYRSEPVDAVRQIQLYQKVLLHHQAFKNDPEYFTPDFKFLIYLCQRVRQCYFPSDGNTVFLLLVKQGAHPALIEYLLGEAAFLTDKEFDYINATNEATDNILPLVFTLYKYAGLPLVMMVRAFLAKGANPDIKLHGEYPSLLHLAYGCEVEEKRSEDKVFSNRNYINECVKEIIMYKQAITVGEIRLMFKQDIMLLESFLNCRIWRASRVYHEVLKKAVPNGYNHALDLFEKKYKYTVNIKDPVQAKLSSALKEVFKKLHFTFNVDVNFSYPEEDYSVLHRIIMMHVDYFAMKDIMDLVLTFSNVDFTVTKENVPACPLVWALKLGDTDFAKKLVLKTPVNQVDLSSLFKPEEKFTESLSALLLNKTWRVPIKYMSDAFVRLCEDAGVGDEYLDFLDRYRSKFPSQYDASMPIYSNF